MNVDAALHLVGGSSLLFFGLGTLKYLTKVEMDNCVKINYSISVSLLSATGLLSIYRGIY